MGLHRLPRRVPQHGGDGRRDPASPAARSGPASLALYAHSVAVVVVLGVLVLISAIASLPRLERPALGLRGRRDGDRVWRSSGDPARTCSSTGSPPSGSGRCAAAAAIVLSIDPRQVVDASLRVLAVRRSLADCQSDLDAAAAGDRPLPCCRSGAASAVQTAPTAPAVIVEVAVALVAHGRCSGIALRRVFGSLVGSVCQSACSWSRPTGRNRRVRPRCRPSCCSCSPFYVLLRHRLLGTGDGPAGCRQRARARRRPTARRSLPCWPLSSGRPADRCSCAMIGTTSYFFLKYLVGIELVLAGLDPRRRWDRRVRSLSTVVAPCLGRAGCAAVALASQALRAVPLGTVGEACASRTARRVSGPPVASSAMAHGLLRALDALDPASPLRPGVPRRWGRNAAVKTFYLDAWYHAVVCYEQSAASVARYGMLRGRLDDAVAAAPAVRACPAWSDPDVEVIVRPSRLARLAWRPCDDEALPQRVTAGARRPG